MNNKEYYKNKKNEIRSLAIEYSNRITPLQIGTVYIESIEELESMDQYTYYLIESYFCEHGKRYGLLKEFHENCIC